jgi:hypothetical protein
MHVASCAGEVVALPPAIANFDYKSVLFGADYVHNVAVGLTVTFMSFLAYAILRLATPYLVGFFRGVAFILCLSVFLFLGLIAVRIAGPGPVPAIVLPPMNQPMAWPSALTKDELSNWSKILTAFHPQGVIIAFVDDQQRIFVIGLAETFHKANWPEPSIQPFRFAVGVHVLAGKNVGDAGRALHDLCEKKLGQSVAFEQPPKMEDDEVEVLVGWQPPD